MSYQIEKREWIPKKYIGELHRSRYIFDCPFCGNELVGFCLNLNGVGRKCKCGSISWADFTTDEESRHTKKYRKGGSVVRQFADGASRIR